jgi:hypothetical protein
MSLALNRSFSSGVRKMVLFLGARDFSESCIYKIIALIFALCCCNMFYPSKYLCYFIQFVKSCNNFLEKLSMSFHDLLELFRKLRDVEYLVTTGGLLALIAIIFSETGLLAGFFFPGDS